MDNSSKVCTVYIGTYTNQGSEGIYGYRLDQESGRMDRLGVMARAENPSYLAFDDSKQHLYAVYETESYKEATGGGVGAYSIDQKKGCLTALNEQFVQGKAPCHLYVDDKRKVMYTANYNSGSISVLTLNQDGSIGTMTDYLQHKGYGPDKERQEKAHAHYVTLTPDEEYLYAVDLGIDQIKRYRWNENNHTLTEETDQTIHLEPGSGPRHIAFHPNGTYMYVVNELSSSVMVYQLESNGTNQLQSVATIPNTFLGRNICSAIKITPDGRFLYVSNRGHDSLAAFYIDPVSGMLELISYTKSGGQWPRDLEIDPLGQLILVANQESDEITAFRIHQETGTLKSLGSVANISKPVCIKIMVQ